MGRPDSWFRLQDTRYGKTRVDQGVTIVRHRAHVMLETGLDRAAPASQVEHAKPRDIAEEMQFVITGAQRPIMNSVCRDLIASAIVPRNIVTGSFKIGHAPSIWQRSPQHKGRLKGSLERSAAAPRMFARTAGRGSHRLLEKSKLRSSKGPWRYRRGPMTIS